MTRGFPAPWAIEAMADCYKAAANGQGLAYLYFRETAEAAAVAKVLNRGRGGTHRCEYRQLPELLNN